MGKYKKWCLGMLLFTLLALIFIAGMVIIVDPFFHYHKPLEMIPYLLDNHSYQNPGIVSNFEYDSLLTGSSMIHCSKTTDFKAVLGCNAIKVPYGGATSKDIGMILEKALKKNPNLKTVYFGLDIMMLDRDADTTKDPIPTYLYNSNPFDDVQYLYNKTVLLGRVIPNIRRARQGEKSTSFDDYMSWGSSARFSQYKTLTHEMTMESRAEKPVFSLNDALQLADDNLRKNILPLLEAYPNVDFVIFYPPYSILYWHINYAPYKFAALEHSVKTLIPYENVKLFLFQNNADMVTNLYNYSDPIHYKPEINSYEVECFKNGTHQLTLENYEAELNAMKALLVGFDCGLLFGESNPFIKENNIIKYLDKLSESRYITFIAARTELPISAYEIFGDRYKQMGLERNKTGCGYIAIVNGENAICQKIDDKAILFNGIVYGMNVEMISEKRTEDHYIEITIDDVKYTTNQEGINIVVYDTKLLRVMDNISLNIENGNISRR